MTRSSTPSGRTGQLLLGAVVVACGGLGLGLVTHSEGPIGQGGVECGSVWFVSAYHSGCAEWLDDMSRVVFAAIAVSATLLLTGLVRWRSWPQIAWVPSMLAGVTIMILGPRLWREVVFLSFGY